MPLTGIDTADKTPRVARELILGAGVSNTSGTSRDVLIYGNKTSAGSETVATIGTPIESDQDARNRSGARSEWYWLYLAYIAVDPTATIYMIAPAEHGSGTASTRVFTIATNASANGTLFIDWGGETVSVAVTSGDTPTTQAAAASLAINNAHDGAWPFTAANVAGAITATSANLGPRSAFALDGIRMRYLANISSTVTPAATTPGANEDDFTAAYAEASAGEYFYQVNPKHSTSALTTTDNGGGEGIEMVEQQFLPTNGKEQVMHFGLICTQAQATTVATSAGANSINARFWHVGETSPWTPGMIAAHCTAWIRRSEMLHPSANTANQEIDIPPPYAFADRLTASEIKADLNNGVSPLRFDTRGAASIVFHISSKSLTGSQPDYRAMPGHYFSAVSMFWKTLQARWLSQKQPFIADEPPQNALPVPKTAYPSTVKALISALIDDFTGPNPLGLYAGPILNPSQAETMKASVAVTRSLNGFLAVADIKAVEHNLYNDFAIREVSGT